VFLYGEATHPGLHGATSQETTLFIVTAVKTSNLTKRELLAFY
jgi:hypothetical protein